MPQHHVGRDVDAVKFSAQVDRSDEVLLDDLPADRIIRIKTAHSTYEYDRGRHRLRAVDGGPHGLDEWVEGDVTGSTFGGSMLAVGRLIPGALMEFYLFGGGVFTTSPIEAIEVIDA